MGFAGWIGFTGVADGVVIGGIVVSDAGSVVFDVAGVEGIDDNCVETIGATGVETIGVTVAMAITGSDTLSSLSSSLSLTPTLTICGGTFGSTACAARKSVGSGASSLSPQPSSFHSSTSGTSLGA